VAGLAEISLKKHPDLIHLKAANEDLSDFLKLSPEALLLRWVNYHLKKAGHKQMATNFSSDFRVSFHHCLSLSFD
jgi:plastin-2/plastin-3